MPYLRNATLLLTGILISALVYQLMQGDPLNAFFFALSIAFLMILLVDFELALLFIIFSLPWSSGFGQIPTYIDVGIITIKISYLMVSMAAIVFAGQMILGRKKWRATPVDKILLIFLAVNFASVFISVDFSISAKELVQRIYFVVLFFLMTNTFVSEASITRAAKIFGVTVAVAALIGLSGIVGFFKSQDVAALERVLVGFSDPNDSANLVVGALALALTFFLAAVRRRALLSQGFYFAMVSILLVALGLSYSRSGWLVGGFVFIMIFLIVGKLRSLPLFMVSILIMIVAVQSIPNFSERLVGYGQDDSSTQRFYLWTAAKNIALDYPLLGIGVGAYPSYLSQHRNEFIGDAGYQIDAYRETRPYNARPGGAGKVAHNAILQMWAEIGTLGLLVFFWLLFLYVKAFVRARPWSLDADLLSYLTVGTSIGALAVLAHNLSISNLSDHYWILAALSLSASLALNLRHSEEGAKV